MRPSWTHSGVVVALLALLVACSPGAPQATEWADEPSFDALFTRVHQEVLRPNCALATCHDGHFEPDFRTVTSAYYTTVLHPPVKNSKDGRFVYRVVPGSPEESLLIERVTNCCFIDGNDRMPLLGEALKPHEIDLLREWIAAGAPDWSGRTSIYGHLFD